MKVGDLVVYKNIVCSDRAKTGIMLENINKRFCRVLWCDGAIRDQLSSELEVLSE